MRGIVLGPKADEKLKEIKEKTSAQDSFAPVSDSTFLDYLIHWAYKNKKEVIEGYEKHLKRTGVKEYDNY